MRRVDVSGLFIISLIFFLSPELFVDVSIRDAVFIAPRNRPMILENTVNDPQAKEAYQKIEKEADNVINREPAPLKVIHYEGVLETDSKRQKTQEHLKDMDRLALVSQAYYGKQKPEYLDFIKRYVWSWGTTYEPTGNPINENKLEAVFCGYYLVKNEFTEREQQVLEEWMAEIVDKESQNTSQDNWETKRFKIIAEIALATDRSDFMRLAVDRFKNYVPNALNADGSSIDFHKRNALSYHVGGMVPLVNFCVLAEQQKIRIDNKSLYEWEASNGASVKKSVHFLDSYVTGKKEHLEFKHSEVQFDKKRCAAGLDEYCPHIWEAGESSTAELYDLASAFEPELSEISAMVLNTDNSRFPTWLSVLVKSGNS